MITILLGAVALATYVTVASIVGRLVYLRIDGKCRNSYHNHASPSVLAGIFWPVSGFIFLGMSVGTWFADQDSRHERREKRKQADHERKLEEIRLQEQSIKTAMDYLEAEGINLFKNKL